ncbi:hypothetical protein SLNWT_2044 [Streptomyces albus]|uniref:Uncharacterized protein n=1 Tax=Streptomyces albus (strain ATCC 21838 / DSM 41398 / FERM P-419 / JCM 4703 / NBRC 107858) TaxID=1081613 RepID=A0A0B5ET39_STRA4|nr:hypothetical protein SLNWT_2044 [Streptomyces albus]
MPPEQLLGTGLRRGPPPRPGLRGGLPGGLDFVRGGGSSGGGRPGCGSSRRGSRRSGRSGLGVPRYGCAGPASSRCGSLRFGGGCRGVSPRRGIPRVPLRRHCRRGRSRSA